jgi:hypothetical protein
MIATFIEAASQALKVEHHQLTRNAQARFYGNGKAGSTLQHCPLQLVFALLVLIFVHVPTAQANT